MDNEQFEDIKTAVVECALMGLESGHLACLFNRAECPEHLLVMLRLMQDGLESDAISGKAARDARRISSALRAEVFERDGRRCVYCSSVEGPFHIDHVLPVSRGGKATLKNLVVACSDCNLSKGGKTLQEWRARGES